MDELKRNGSGYYDKTAYKAIKNYSRGTCEMVVNKGEIWEAETANGDMRTVLAVSCQEKYAVVLYLMNEKQENNIPVTARTIMYTDPARLQYVFYDRIVNFIKTVPEGEFETVLEEIADRLELPVYRTASEEAPVETGRQEPSAKADRIRRLENENAAFRQECSIYKELYQSLLERVIGGARHE